MSQPRLLPVPPLNSPDHPSTVRVSAHQFPPSEPPAYAVANGRSEFIIIINFTANFRSSDPADSRTMPGFSSRSEIKFPTNYYMIGSAVSDFIPVPLNDIHWEARTHDGLVQSASLLFDEDELNHRVAGFLIDLKTAPCNAGQRELSVDLTIVKEITLPAEEFAAWTSWYDEQAASDENFEIEFAAAIMGQRRERGVGFALGVITPDIYPVEGLEDQVSSGWRDTTDLEEVCYEGGDAKEQCSICLEEFVVGSSVARLPVCSHVYHLRCVSQWLERNDACPLCRTVLPSSDSPYVRFEIELPRS
ncbi:hypothetical protein C3L33_04758, partial [Rhododendron williamsianum]